MKQATRTFPFTEEKSLGTVSGLNSSQCVVVTPTSNNHHTGQLDFQRSFSFYLFHILIYFSIALFTVASQLHDQGGNINITWTWEGRGEGEGDERVTRTNKNTNALTFTTTWNLHFHSYLANLDDLVLILGAAEATPLWRNSLHVYSLIMLDTLYMQNSSEQASVSFNSWKKTSVP